MDLDHGVLVLPVVVRGDGSGGSDQLHDLGKLVHLGPVCRVEAIAIPQVDISPVFYQQFDYLHVAEPCRVMEYG